MQKVEGSSPFSRSSAGPAQSQISGFGREREARLGGLFRARSAKRMQNPAPGEGVVGLGERATHDRLERRQGRRGVVDVLLVDLGGGPVVLVTHQLPRPPLPDVERGQYRGER